VVRFTLLPLYPRGNGPRYPFDRRLVGPRAGLDDREKRKFSILPGIELNPSVVQPVAVTTTLSGSFSMDIAVNYSYAISCCTVLSCDYITSIPSPTSAERI
jgi:hypothetical protein